MITAKKLLGAAVILGTALLATSSATAQIQAGLLGKRYVGVTVFSEDISQNGIDNGTGTTLGVNLPLNANFDFSVNGFYERISTNSFNEKRAWATLTAYQEMSGFKPFLDLSLGNRWQSSSAFGQNFSSSDGNWTVGGGVEAPIADATALVGRVAYTRNFDKGQHWTYTFGVNHWFNEKISGVASVSFWESESTTYSVGLNFRF